MANNHIGLSIRKIREEKKISQRTLAKLAKTSQSAIARIEAGVIDPRLSTVVRIGKALDAHLIFMVNRGELKPTSYDFEEDEE